MVAVGADPPEPLGAVEPTLRVLDRGVQRLVADPQDPVEHAVSDVGAVERQIGGGIRARPACPVPAVRRELRFQFVEGFCCHTYKTVPTWQKFDPAAGWVRCACQAVEAVVSPVTKVRELPTGLPARDPHLGQARSYAVEVGPTTGTEP
ncbi:hypothetical protein Cci01nite_79940 [Catellatospora citrea]|uniref:Uncharacterized protein n=1 Tax=Catellatospora citrea TaxID=53366 RepID=A0A8J3KTI2_9ACTN|nr:hypothetical protein Cci01nite_79940 [Catellatospora citrea]